MTQSPPHPKRPATCECGVVYCLSCYTYCPNCSSIHLAPEKAIEGPQLPIPLITTPFHRIERPDSIRLIEELKLTGIGVGTDGSLGVAGIVKKSRRLSPSEQAQAIGDIRKAGYRYETSLDREDR